MRQHLQIAVSICPVNLRWMKDTLIVIVDQQLAGNPGEGRELADL